MARLDANYHRELPEAESIKSLLYAVRLLAVIFGVLLFLFGIVYLAIVLVFARSCGMMAFGTYCGAPVGAALVGPVLLLIFGVVDVVIYLKMKEIEGKVNARQYEAAKEQTLVWMILGFILGGVIVGILLVIAYVKFDPLIRTAQLPPVGGAGFPSGAYSVPPPLPPSPPTGGAPPPPTTAPFCTKCGRPTTYIPQYGRFYCYDDQLYA